MMYDFPPEYPLIVIGMHRSGTSMITKFLAQLGLFMGQDQTTNEESRFFVYTNRWLLRESGGGWDHPETVDSLVNDPAVRPLLVDFMRFAVNSPRVAMYLGWPGYIRNRSLYNLDFPWGWKDPRNTFTLPLWLDVFPRAKVLHIYRNGVDVANSLHVRGKTAIQKGQALSHWKTPSNRLLYRIWPRVFPPFTTRNMSLETGFKLWENYTQRADEMIVGLPSNRTLEICYEAFLEDPVPILQSLCNFTGLKATQAQIEVLCSQVKPSRGRAYEHDENLQAFYDEVKTSPQMMRYGY